MAQLVITIPDDKVVRIREAFVAKYGWTPDLGITKAEFTKQQLIAHIKQVVKETEGEIQSWNVRQTTNADVDTIAIT